MSAQHHEDLDGSAPPPTDHSPTLTGVLLALSVATTMAWLALGARWDHAGNLALIGAALVLHGATWLRRGARSPLTLRGALIALGVCLAATVVVPLHHSRDLYLYDIYGQAVAEHRVSPYTTTPAQLGDPQLDLVAEKWHDQTSMYGPAFVALAAVVSRAGGGSELLVRLSWQALTAAAAMAALILVARRTRDPMAVLALGCSPVLLATVHDAHNDVLIGLGLLAVVLLVDDHRYVLGGGIAALVIAVKAPAAVPIAAVAVWLCWRRGWRPALWFGAPLAAAITTAYLAVGGREALQPLRENAGDDSRFALWQPWRDARFEELLAHGVRWRTTLETVRDEMTTYALVLLVVVLLVALWRYRRAGHPGEVAGVAALALMLTSTYVMPWYPAMVLPVVALAWRSRTSRLVQVQAGFLMLAYAQGPGIEPSTGLGQWFEQRAAWINLALLAAVVLWSRPQVLAPSRPAARRRVETDDPLVHV